MGRTFGEFTLERSPRGGYNGEVVAMRRDCYKMVAMVGCVGPNGNVTDIL